MRIIIPTRVHLPRMKAHRLFSADQVTFVVEGQDEYEKILKEFPGFHVAVSNVRREVFGIRTIAYTRQWISQYLLEDGEWALLVDDNVERLTRVHDDFYFDDKIYLDDHDNTSRMWRKIFAQPADPWELAYELRVECIEAGTIFGGLAAEENYFYRTTKWSRASYTKAKFAVWKNDRSLSWVPFKECMFEDFVMTVQVVAKYGCVMNNRFARMHNQYYELGGIGSFDERLELVTQNCAWLMEKYPGLLKHPRGEQFLITFAIHHPTSILRWRQQHGYV